MAEITNLNTYLQNNKFKDVILPLIGYFNPAVPTVGDRSPWSALAAGALLANRSLKWGLGSGDPSYAASNYKKCCCPDEDPSQGTSISCEYVRITQQGGGPPCPACESVGTEVVGPATTTQEELIRMGAADAGFADPYTPEIRKFEKQLMGISMNGSNDYVYFQQLVDAFYNNVGFTYYFTNTVLNGQASDLYLGMLGGNFKDGYHSTGLVVDTVSDGDAGTSSLTEVFTGGVGFVAASAAEGAYFSAFTTDAQYIVWWKVNGQYVQPVVGVTLGYAQTYIEVAIPHLISSAAVMTATIDAINTAIGIDTISDMQAPILKAGASDIVQWSPIPVGSFPTSSYDLPNFPESGWVENFGKYVTYVDGTAAGGGEVTSINFTEAKPNALIGTWFKMYGEAGDGDLFYYQTPSNIIDPTTLGTTYTTARPITIAASGTGCVPACEDDEICLNGNCAKTSRYIEQITSDAIIGTGLYAAAGYAEKCCQCVPCKDYAGDPCTPAETPECCGPCKRYGTVSALDFTDSDGGTSAIGGTYQNNDVVAPDGKVFATGVEDDFEYARIWNQYLVPYWKGLGNDTHYLKPVAASQIWCWISGTQKAQIPGPGPCPELPSTERITQGYIFIQTTYLSVTDQMRFNASGVTSWSGQAEPCKTCLF